MSPDNEVSLQHGLALFALAENFNLRGDLSFITFANFPEKLTFLIKVLCPRRNVSFIMNDPFEITHHLSKFIILILSLFCQL